MTADGGSHGTHSSASVPTSGGQVRVLTSNGTKEPATFTFTFPRNATSYSALALRVLKSQGSGQIEANINGHPLRVNGTEKYDLYSATTTAAHLKLGGARLAVDGAPPGNHKINIKLYGGSGKVAYIDYIHVIPISQVTYDSFALAKNNDAYAPLNTEANIGPSTANEGIDAQELADAGYTPGTHVTHGGTTFYIQPHAGNDNVMAMGQTITLDADQQRKASSVDLLATTTCKPMSPYSTPYPSVGVNYAGLTSEDSNPDTKLIPIPDWLTPTALTPELGAATVTKEVTLPHYTVMGKHSTSGKTPSIYHIRVLTNPDWAENYEVVSVTLPSVGTDELGDCNNPVLHIFSIATTP